MRTLFNIIFPRYCLLCKKSEINEDLLCKICTQELPYLRVHHCQICAIPLKNTAVDYCGSCLEKPPAFDHTIALFEYKEPVNHFITQLKFNQQLVYGELLARLLADKIKALSSDELPECLIPVPLHTHRLRERGYNQALCIARSLAKQLHIPLNYNDCLRFKATEAQSGLKVQARKNNVRNAFRLNRKIPFESVAIIDDVMTTGQTAHEFARLLKKNGVKRVEIWCGARVLLGNS